MCLCVSLFVPLLGYATGKSIVCLLWSRRDFPMGSPSANRTFFSFGVVVARLEQGPYLCSHWLSRRCPSWLIGLFARPHRRGGRNLCIGPGSIQTAVRGNRQDCAQTPPAPRCKTETWNLQLPAYGVMHRDAVEFRCQRCCERNNMSGRCCFGL